MLKSRPVEICASADVDINADIDVRADVAAQLKADLDACAELLAQAAAELEASVRGTKGTCLPCLNNRVLVPKVALGRIPWFRMI